MPASTRTPQSRPPGAPAYYLGRPASWWLTALHQRAGHHLPRRAEAGPTRTTPAG
jgi:hypothetical protein